MHGVLLLCLALAFPVSATAAEYATRDEAVAMVGKAVAALRAEREPTLKAITARDARFQYRDLYVTVYDLNGLMLAHGTNVGMVGKNLIELRDIDGTPYVKERIALARRQGKFWHDYKFTDPLTKTVLPKSMYCERQDDMVVCAGVYKR